MISRQVFFTLFASVYPTDADWRNYATAGRPRLMVMLDMLRAADSGPVFIQRLKAEQVPSIVIRVSEPDIYHVSPFDIREQVRAVIGAGVLVDAVVLGNEPEGGIPWHYKRPEDPPDYNWGQAFAYYHAGKVQQHIRVLKGLGIGGVKIGERLPVSVVTPGWTCRDLWEDAELEPGFYAWRDIVRDTGYWEADGFSLHSYSAYWDDKEEPIRHKKRLQEYLKAFHYGPAWIGEFGILDVADPNRFRYYIQYAEHIRTHRVYGPRVRMFCPFVWTGNPWKDPSDHSKGTYWDPRYLVEGTYIYTMLGAYIARGMLP